MTTLVVGASGATGRQLVMQLLDRDEPVKAIVRSSATFPADLRSHAGLSLIEASLLELDDDELAGCTAGCRAVASCLGHNLNFRGIFGPPRHLVTDAVRRLCAAIRTNRPEAPVKFVLMNTTGNRNRDRDESLALADRLVIGALRAILPPQVDNEEAAEQLRVGVGRQDPLIEWVTVRPDNLIDEEQVSPYDVHPSPTRGVIFDAGKTSRINVSHFMAELITDDTVWSRWQGQMPVIYNRET